MANNFDFEVLHSLKDGMCKIILFVTVIMLYTACAGAVECGPGEVLDDCPSNCTDSCPTMNGEFKNCLRPNLDECRSAKCVCQFNYRRALNGTCIPTIECPAFECLNPNEEYNSCPSYCPTDDCKQATPNGECPYVELLPILEECGPSCRCKPTYWRKNGVCVPYQQCDNIDQLESNN